MMYQLFLILIFLGTDVCFAEPTHAKKLCLPLLSRTFRKDVSAQFNVWKAFHVIKPSISAYIPSDIETKVDQDDTKSYEDTQDDNDSVVSIDRPKYAFLQGRGCELATQSVLQVSKKITNLLQIDGNVYASGLCKAFCMDRFSSKFENFEYPKRAESSLMKHAVVGGYVVTHGVTTHHHQFFHIFKQDACCDDAYNAIITIPTNSFVSTIADTHKVFICTNKEEQIEIYDFSGQVPQKKIIPLARHTITSMAVIPGTTSVAVACNTGDIKIFDYTSGQEKYKLGDDEVEPCGADHQVESMFISDNQKLLLSVDTHKWMKFWDLENNNCITSVQLPEQSLFQLYNNDLYMVDNSEPIKRFTKSNAAGKEEFVLDLHENISVMKFLSNGIAALGTSLGSVYFIDSVTGEIMHTKKYSDTAITGIEYRSHDGILCVADEQKVYQDVWHKKSILSFVLAPVIKKYSWCKQLCLNGLQTFRSYTSTLYTKVFQYTFFRYPGMK